MDIVLSSSLKNHDITKYTETFFSQIYINVHSCCLLLGAEARKTADSINQRFHIYMTILCLTTARPHFQQNATAFYLNRFLPQMEVL